MKKPGKVYLVGAGPGDPTLLTQKAASLLAEASSIVHDRLIPPLELLEIRPDARLHRCGQDANET